MRDRLIQIVAIVILFAGVLGAFALSPTINQQRVDRQLTYDVEVGDKNNPAYTAAAALGSFRGVLINVMWQRSEALKQEGKFFEANNLAEQITTLQPRYPEAWNFQAWNMAYNISVKCKTKEERWDWVDKGINLLRDRGIPNNPDAVVLYRSLAWILGHKMTGQTDDMHWYYKARMAERWQVILGVPRTGRGLKREFQGDNRPPSEELDAALHGEWNATLDMMRIVDAANAYLRKSNRPEDDFGPANYFDTLSPDALSRFYEANPGLREVVEQIEAIKGPSGEELDLGLNARTLRAFGRIQMFRDAGYQITSPAVNNVETLGADSMALFNWLLSLDDNVRLNLNPFADIESVRARAKEQNPKARVVDLVPMLDLLRAKVLVGDFNMDPAFMLETMKEYGPIDWRHPASHACYWSKLGTLRAAQWVQNKDRVDFLNANRSTIHALQHLSHTGKINFRPKVESLGQFGEERINHSPDTRMIPAYGRALDRFKTKAFAGDFGEDLSMSSFENGHENFLQAAVFLYFFEGNHSLANQYFDEVKSLYSNSKNSPAAQEGQYNLSLSDFSIVRMEDALGFQNVAAINYWIRLAWTYGIAERDRAVMARYLGAAKRSYDEFLEERQTVMSGDRGVQGRQDLQPFEDFILEGYLQMMLGSEFSLIQKASMWELAAPLLASISEDRPLLYQCYAMLLPIAEEQLKLEQWDIEVSTAFPPPRGFAEWYQQFVEQPAAPTPLIGN